jgi:predicted GIY-YIG superfamily endonuclease
MRRSFILHTGHTDNLEARLSSHHDGTFKGYISRKGSDLYA